ASRGPSATVPTQSPEDTTTRPDSRATVAAAPGTSTVCAAAPLTPKGPAGPLLSLAPPGDNPSQPLERPSPSPLLLAGGKVPPSFRRGDAHVASDLVSPGSAVGPAGRPGLRPAWLDRGNESQGQEVRPAGRRARVRLQRPARAMPELARLLD